MKLEMTSVDIAALVYELNETIIGARIENIYQTGHLTIIFRLHQPNQPTLQLLIESGRRIHLTSYILSKPLAPPAFCMALRKHLRNGRIIEIQQNEFEREINIRIGTREGTFLLVTELFGDGNIILVHPQGKILFALTYKRMRDRNIIRGENYRHAPSSGRNPLHLGRRDLDEIKHYGRLEIVRALTKLLSIGGLYAEEILLRGEIDKKMPCEELTKEQIDVIFTQTQTLVSKTINGEFEPSIIVDEEGQWIDVTPLPLRKYATLTAKPYKSFSEALDEYYSKSLTIGKVADTGKEYVREQAKLQRTLEDQQRTLEDSEKIIEQNKAIGNIIYAHLGEIQLLAQGINEEKTHGKTWEQIVTDIEGEKQAGHVPFIYFQSLDSRQRVLNVSVENATFSLDLTQSIPANAANYYKRAKKTKRKQEGARRALQDTLIKMQELQKHLIEKTEAIEEAPIKKKEKAWYEKFRWFNSSEGFLVIAGRDATTNEIIIKKHTEPTDIVFHADIVGAPFVIIKTKGKIPSDQTINEAAQLAASYSKAWRELFHAIDVYWVHPGQLSKSPPPGQYLEKGSFIVHGKKNYLRKILLSIAIGVAIKDNHITTVGGPTTFVKKQIINYVEVIPGKEPSSSIAKQVRQLLTEKAPAELRKQIMAIPLEEIQNFIPSGKGAIALQP